MLINKSAVKKFILSTWKEKRGCAAITRVSQEAIDYYERALSNLIVKNVMDHPSCTKTYNPLLGTPVKI